MISGVNKGGELVEVNGCVDGDRRTWVAECTGGGGTIDRGDSSEGHHLDVVTGHELNLHRLPLSSRVWGPPDLTSASLIIDMSRIRNSGDGISQDNQCQGQNESRESATRKHWNKTFCRAVY
jgi:hypothetical protein